MKSCSLIIITCLLHGILAVSLEKTKENGALRRRIVEKDVPSSYKKAYNILMKANDLKARSHTIGNAYGEESEGHSPGDGHFHEEYISPITSNLQRPPEHVNQALHHVASENDGNGGPPPIDPLIKLEVSEILARTIQDINDRLFSLAENIRILSQSQLILNARLSAVETSVGVALIPAVIGIHNQQQSVAEHPSSQAVNPEDNTSPPEPAQHVSEDDGSDDGGLQEHLDMVHQLLGVAADKIDDATYIVESEEGKVSAVPPNVNDEQQQTTATPSNVKGEQQQTNAMTPHDNEEQQATVTAPHDNEEEEEEEEEEQQQQQQQQQAAATPPHGNGEQQQTSASPSNVKGEQQATATPSHGNGEQQDATATSLQGNSEQQQTTAAPSNVKGEQQQQATAMSPHSSDNGETQQTTAMPPHGNDEQQKTTAAPPNVKGEQQQATSMPPHDNGETQQATAMPPHDNEETQQTTAIPPHGNGDQQQTPADDGVIEDEKNIPGDHRRYSFRGYNPFTSDRRGDLLNRLRAGLPHRQVPARVPVLPRQKAQLDQTWYQQRYGEGI